MSIRILLSCFALFCLIGAISWTSGSAVAKSESASCTKKDMKQIAGFNLKAGKKIDEHNRLKKDASLGRIGSLSEMSKLTGKRDKIKQFFNSREYHAMAPVYARCDVPMPKL